MRSAAGRALATNEATSRVAIALLLLSAGAGCRGSSANIGWPEPTSLRVGYGLAAGASPEIGSRQAARVISLESLVVVGTDGRPLPRLAESWLVSDDHLTWRIRLRGGGRFHTGQRLDAAIAKKILDGQLSTVMGPAYDDVAEILAVSERDLEVRLKRPSAFLMELLDLVTIQQPASPLTGAGPLRTRG